MALLLGTPVDMVPLPPGTVRSTPVKVTSETRFEAPAPQMVGLKLLPLWVPLMLSKVMPLIVPTPGLLPHRLRVPIFIMIGELVLDMVMFR